MLRLMRPPSSTPNTTSLQRLARWSSGYVRCFRSRAWARARPGSLSAPGRALPSRLTGLTIVASTATWAPCQRGRPFATTSMRRPSAAGTSRFKSRRATFVATRAPASLQMRAAARSSGPARLASAPTWAQAERWSPRSSRRPPQAQCLGASGSGSRSLRSSRTRYSASGTAVSGLEGVAVKVQPAASPPCDSSSARDAGSRSAKSVPSARVCKEAPAACCQPGRLRPPSHCDRGAAAASSLSSSDAQGGASNPWERRCCAACSAARALRGVLAADTSNRGRTRSASVPGW